MSASPAQGRAVRGYGIARSRRAVAVALALATALAATTERAAPQGTLRLVAYNVKHGQGMDGVVDLRRAARVLRELDPDVVTLQEIDRGVDRTGGVDQARRLGELLGMEAFFGPFMEYGGGEYGMAVLTRLPVAAGPRGPSVNHRLPDGAEPRSALEVRVAVGPERREVAVVGIHLYRTPEERWAQADSLAALFGDDTGGGDDPPAPPDARAAPGEREVPVILAGDFNSPPDSRVLARLREAGWTALPKDGPRATFPADDPEREIDYVMVRPAGAFEVLEHRVVAETLVSDHRPLLAVLRLW